MPESLARTPNVPLSPAHAGEARLSGGWLFAARAAWIAFTTVLLGLLVVVMPLAYQQIVTPRTGPQCADSRLSAAQLSMLHAAGVSSAFFAGWIIAIQCVSTVTYVGVAALLFWRRSENRMALLAATALVPLGTSFSDPHWLGAACALGSVWPAAALLYHLLGSVGNLLVPVLFYTFPSGKWVPRWSGWLFLGWFLLSPPAALLPAVVSDFLAAHQWIGNVIGGLEFGTLAFAQVYRYWHASTPAERLQTKWVVLGSAIGLGGVSAVIGLGATSVFGGFHPTAASWPMTMLYLGTTIQLCFTLIPISIGIALLRSRLFDVDVVINRVLVYGSLTGMLGLLYLGSVIGLQGLLRSLTGQTNPLVIVASTLAIVALAGPLRRALQNGIDRRFYRRKYDAARTLAAFSATLRNEVELARLRAHLLAVVRETMQPVHASLWLRAPSPESSSTPAPPLEPAAAWTIQQARADSTELP